MMRCLLSPSSTADTVLDVDYSMLKQAGIAVCLFDLDGTLCTPGTRRLDPTITSFLSSSVLAGFELGILTNRRRNATDPIIHQLGQLLPVMARAGKPGVEGFHRMLGRLSVKPNQAAMIGDRFLTDVLGANRARLGAAIRVRKPLPIGWSALSSRAPETGG